MDVSRAVTGYLAKRKEMETNWGNPGHLSDILLKIAAYLAYIGDDLGRLKEEYETQRAKSYFKHLNDGKSVSNAENLSRSENAALRGQIAKLEVTHKNGWSLVSIGQSRLRVLENEAKNQS